MEEKTARLEKEIDFFKAKEKKLGQHWDKDTLVIKKSNTVYKIEEKLTNPSRID